MSRQRRMALRFGGATIVALLGLSLFAGTTFAHQQTVTLNCQSGLTVDLVNYSQSGDSRFYNTVSIVVDGSPVTGSTFQFGSTFHYQLNPILPSTTGHSATIVVTAFDDPTNIYGFSPTFNLEMGACTEATPTPTPTPPVIPCTPANNCFFNTPPPPPSTPTPTPVPTATPTPSASPSPSGAVLGATGTPNVTPPSTSTIGSSGGSTGSGLPIAVAAVVGLGLSVLLLTPRRAVSRTSRRRR